MLGDTAHNFRTGDVEPRFVVPLKVFYARFGTASRRKTGEGAYFIVVKRGKFAPGCTA